jgi:hypothetical protein
VLPIVLGCPLRNAVVIVWLVLFMVFDFIV